MTLISDLWQYLQMELPGAPQPIVLQTARTMIDEFCRRTDAWQEALAAMDYAADTLDYALSPAASASVHRILLVKLDDTELQPYTYTLEDGNTLRFASAPASSDSAGGLVVIVSLRPTLDCTELTQAFMERWYDTFCSGVKWRMMAMPRRSWSNPEMAQVYIQNWNRGIGEARMEIAGPQYKAGDSVYIPTATF